MLSSWLGHAETIKCVVQAGKDFGVKVMGDNMVCESMVDGAKFLEDLGCDYVIHHVGYDERRGIAAAGERMPNPLDELREVVAAVKVPVQAVGGLTLEQAIECPRVRRAAGRPRRATDDRCRCLQDSRWRPRRLLETHLRGSSRPGCPRLLDHEIPGRHQLRPGEGQRRDPRDRSPDHRLKRVSCSRSPMSGFAGAICTSGRLTIRGR